MTQLSGSLYHHILHTKPQAWYNFHYTVYFMKIQIRMATQNIKKHLYRIERGLLISTDKVNKLDFDTIAVTEQKSSSSSSG